MSTTAEDLPTGDGATGGGATAGEPGTRRPGRRLDLDALAGDARVVSVVFDDERADVERLFDERGGEWPVLDDPDGRVALDWGVLKLPESYLVDPDGLVRAKIAGGVTADFLDGVLAEAQGGGPQ